ncbi:hypothetical protein M422DRAFT_272624 [Sphaerobolus stellatus SS14]|uniref:DUF6570 domain-containing protein n=1 Tax=Sphaerobolus stellatus (strain SS14) TaxID=990650 RepID=A0A0C9UB78_SPHS4|nr:hypothetical protein M422DRAFT_272624 [Sphaerobolus stellatus SS14]
MNFLSTAESLPRAPAEVNGMLSVVFVSQAKFDPSKIGDVFAVRNQKIWDFLLWLREHNILYRDIPLRQDIMDEYPENDILPGLAESVIVDSSIDPDTQFNNESAGIQEHPSSSMWTVGPLDFCGVARPVKEGRAPERMVYCLHDPGLNEHQTWLHLANDKSRVDNRKGRCHRPSTNKDVINARKRFQEQVETDKENRAIQVEE